MKLRYLALYAILSFVPVSAVAGNVYAQAEAVGKVSTVFPESRVVVINGQKYRVADDAKILGIKNKNAENLLAEIEAGARIQYATQNINRETIISIIIVTDE